MSMSRPRFLPENFTLALIATVVVASELPCRGTAALVVDHLTDLAIALLFFLHGAKLSREAVIAAASHWRLHALVLLTTFVLFPLFGLAFRPILSPLATPTLYAGILFLCTLPSTVQSSIAFTAIAKGNVPAALCSASASSIIGIFVTPLVAGLLLSNDGGAASGWDAIGQITLQLFVPFVCGQLLQPFIGGWIGRHDGIVGAVDQGSILLIVYSALQRGRQRGVVASGSASCARGIGRCRRHPSWRRPDHDRTSRQMAGLQSCRSSGHYLLWLEEEPVPGSYHGQGDLCFPWGGGGDPPAHGLPSDSTDGLRRAGPAMGSSCRALCARLGRRQVRCDALTKVLPTVFTCR
ncbi:putative Na+-dependent transporter [Bradyrhizobium sp. F1.13.4]